VLAASKRLMNRVFNLASDMGLNLYYTDTDSFVCEGETEDGETVHSIQFKCKQVHYALRGSSDT